LISFKGENKNDCNLLEWVTANEINNNGFEVYRSTDSKNFKKIGFVPVVSTSTSLPDHFYNFKDVNLESNLYYYQLCQVDLNGHKRFTNVISIKTKNSEDSFISVFPNPASDNFNISFNDNYDGRATVKLYNLQGKLVYTQNFETIKSHFLLQINLTDLKLSKNCYFLSIQTNETTFSKKILIN